MTYILGARCSDGVVMVADTKVIRGSTDVSHEYKLIQPLPNVVVGASGVTGIFHKFLISIQKIANEKLSLGEYKADEFIEDCEDISKKLTDRYLPRVKDVIEVLVAFRAGDRSELYLVSPDGFSEPVQQYFAIGHGQPYGSFFLKRFWLPTLTMDEVARLGCFIINYIQHFNLDNSVGGSSPQIWLLPDLPSNFNNLTEEEKVKYSIKTVTQSDIKTNPFDQVTTLNAFFNTFKPF